MNVIDDAASRLNTAYANYIALPEYSVSGLFKALEDTIKALKTNSENDGSEHTLLRKYIVKNSQNFIETVAPFIKTIPKNQLVFAAESILDIK